MRCDACKSWTTSQVTSYADGSEITNWFCDPGKGKCDVLSLETPLDFGCVKFVAGSDHIVRKWKNGSPWQHWEAVDCPDCRGIGSTAVLDTTSGLPRMVGGTCSRCVGMGKVQKHDDGYISDNHTKIHPKERELKKSGPLKCQHCDREVDIQWIICPYCARRPNERMEEPEMVDAVLGNAGGLVQRPASIQGKREILHQGIDAMNQVDAERWNGAAE